MYNGDMNNRTLYSIAVPLAVMGIISLMVVPVPQFMLDFLIATNISVSILLLFITIYIVRPLELSAYPSILLVMTLFRLSLNVATTRAILLHATANGDGAGNIIKAFGQFVVGGNYLVGFTIFVILIIIQFVVITKGATRIAEVAARFTLDAMPGKQMAIDADLNAGLIDDKEARRRREDIRREADFYGAMDGASKFVRGDAIAGIIITIINIVVGFIIGIAQKGMPWDVAGATYTILTVGDGLVTQIPALIVSTSAGMIVTRAASESDFGSEFIRQMTSQPKALVVASITLGLFAFIPGFPFLPFMTLSLILAAIAYTMTRKPPELAAADAETGEEAPVQVTPEEERREIGSMMQVDTLELEIGYGLIFLVDKDRGGDLLNRISMIRKQIAMDVGFIMSPIRIRDNMQLKPNQYAINIKGVQASVGELMPDYLLAMNPGTATGELDGIATIEPVFKLSAIWIRKEDKERAEVNGYTVVEPAAIIATHLTEIVKRKADEILTRQDVNELLDNAKKQNAVVVDELMPGKLSIGNLQKIIQNLLHEGVSVRDMTTILETIADYVDTVKDIDILTEYVRMALSRQFVRNHMTGDTLQVYTLDPNLEQSILASLKQTSFGMNVSLEPNAFKKLIDAIKKYSTDRGISPIFLVSPNVRPYFKRLIEGYFPDAVVLSFNEVDPAISVQVVGMIGAD